MLLKKNPNNVKIVNFIGKHDSYRNQQAFLLPKIPFSRTSGFYLSS